MQKYCNSAGRENQLESPECRIGHISHILFFFLLTLKIVRAVRVERRRKPSQHYILVLLAFTYFNKYRATPLE